MCVCVSVCSGYVCIVDMCVCSGCVCVCTCVHMSTWYVCVCSCVWGPEVSAICPPWLFFLCSKQALSLSRELTDSDSLASHHVPRIFCLCFLSARIMPRPPGLHMSAEDLSFPCMPCVQGFTPLPLAHHLYFAELRPREAIL